MSTPGMVGIDLLPPELAAARARQRNVIAQLSLSVLLVLTMLVFFASESNRLVATERERDIEQAEVNRLRGEESGLFEFGQLEQNLSTNVQVLQGALAREIGAAGVLQDLAAVLPTNAGLDRLTFDTQSPDEPAFLVITGETRAGFAPGIERLMIGLDKVASFMTPKLTSSVIDDEYTIFEIKVTIDEGAYTGRYRLGLPGELR